MRSKLKIFVSGILVLLTFVLLDSCKKTNNSEPTKPPNPEIFFDHKDGDAMGYNVGGKWNTNAITWHVEKWCNSLSESETRDMLKKAFKVWSDVSVLTFTEVTNINNADIVISFGDNQHYTNVINNWCPVNFNVTWQNYGVLAHTFFPPSQPLAGDIHFCDLHRWSPYGEASNSSVSLLSVAIHEIGHAIGIDHSNDITAIMYASYDPLNIKYSLSQDDIDAVQFLYTGGNNSTAIIRISGVCPASVQVNNSQSFIMTIHNDGNRTLNVTNLNISNNSAGAFSFANGTPSLPISIPAYDKFDIEINFSPPSALIYNATLTVTSNASSGTNTSSLTGAGDNSPTSNNTFTDSRDGKIYEIVTIGNQTWMAEDLNYNQTNSVTHNSKRFYDYNTALTVAPSGWHLPSDAEWQELEVYLGMTSSEANTDGYRGTDQGYKVSIGGTSRLDLGYNGYGVENFDGTITFYSDNQKGGFLSSTRIGTGGGLNSVVKGRMISTSIPSKIFRFNTDVTKNYYSVRCVKN